MSNVNYQDVSTLLMTPNPRRDFNRAREVAQLVLTSLKDMHHPLADHLRTPDPKHLALRY